MKSLCSICGQSPRTRNGYCKQCNAARRRGSYYYKRQAQSNGIVAAKLYSMGWLGKGIVYIRQVDEEGLGTAYYIGKTGVPLNRYGTKGIMQFIYLENIDSEDERTQREKEIICEFVLAGLLVLNRANVFCTPK